MQGLGYALLYLSFFPFIIIFHIIIALIVGIGLIFIPLLVLITPYYELYKVFPENTKFTLLAKIIIYVQKFLYFSLYIIAVLLIISFFYFTSADIPKPYLTETVKEAIVSVKLYNTVFKNNIDIIMNYIGKVIIFKLVNKETIDHFRLISDFFMPITLSSTIYLITKFFVIYFNYFFGKKFKYYFESKWSTPVLDIFFMIFILVTWIAFFVIHKNALEHLLSFMQIYVFFKNMLIGILVLIKEYVFTFIDWFIQEFLKEILKYLKTYI